MKDDLTFKEGEMEKSKYTASGLAHGKKRSQDSVLPKLTTSMIVF